MTINKILDNKLEQYINKSLPKFLVYQYFGGHSDNVDLLIDRIDDFVYGISKDEHKMYCLRYFHNYIANIQLEDSNTISRDKENIRVWFEEKKALMLGHIALELDDIGDSLSDEIFTAVEFEEFKSKLSDIAASIFEFQQRQEAANEVIYNSVEELRDQLISDAEKGKIFGKEFVKQQLAGKVIDMTVKGGAITVISNLFPGATKLLTDIL